MAGIISHVFLKTSQTVFCACWTTLQTGLYPSLSISSLSLFMLVHKWCLISFNAEKLHSQAAVLPGSAKAEDLFKWLRELFIQTDSCHLFTRSASDSIWFEIRGLTAWRFGTVLTASTITTSPLQCTPKTCGQKAAFFSWVMWLKSYAVLCCEWILTAKHQHHLFQLFVPIFLSYRFFGTVCPLVKLYCSGSWISWLRVKSSPNQGDSHGLLEVWHYTLPSTWRTQLWRHPAHGLFSLFPSGRRLHSIWAKTTRLKNSCFLDDVRLLNCCHTSELISHNFW